MDPTSSKMSMDQDEYRPPTPHPRDFNTPNASYFDLEVSPNTSVDNLPMEQPPPPTYQEPAHIRPGYFARTHSDTQLESTSPNKWTNPFETKVMEGKRPSLSNALSFDSNDPGDEESDEDVKLVRPPLEFDPQLSYKEKIQFLRQRGREIVEHFEGQYNTTGT